MDESFFPEPLSITEEEDWGLPGKRMINGYLDWYKETV